MGRELICRNEENDREFADDFSDLAGRVSAASYRVLRPQPRGSGGSWGSLEGITLREIAADLAAVSDTLNSQPAFVVGHAFRNRVARMLANERPEWVRAAILLVVAGKRPWTRPSGIH